jgi:putative endonuclease
MNAAERRARWHYAVRGYRILDTNAWAGGNELDLVVRRGGKLIFCEVKSRSRTDYGGPVEMVRPEKLRRVRRAAEAWLAAHPECAGLAVRFEVVGVHGKRLQRVPADF